MKNRRIGKFYIDGRQIFEGDLSADFFSLLGFVPLRVEHLAYSDQFEYIGISDLFHESSTASMIREYQVTAHQDADNKIIGISVE